MLKLLKIILLLSSLSLYATQTEEAQVMDFIRQSLAFNEHYEIKEIVLIGHEPLEALEGWEAYRLRIDLHLLKQEGRVISLYETLFSNGVYLSRDFFDLSTGKSIKQKSEEK